MEIKIIPCLNDNYSYLISDKNKKIACVIDPSESLPVIKEIEKNQLNLKYILNTHHHYDHVGGNKELKKKYGSKVVGFNNDKDRIPEIDILVKNNQIWKDENFEAKIYHIPGHTLGHIAFHFFKEKKIKLEGLSRGLPQPDHLLEEAVQRLDSETDRLDLSLKNRLEQNAERLDGLHARLRHPGDVIASTGDRLIQTLERLDLAILAKLQDNLRRFEGLDTGVRLPSYILRIFETSQDWLVAQSHLLESEKSWIFHLTTFQQRILPLVSAKAALTEISSRTGPILERQVRTSIFVKRILTF